MAFILYYAARFFVESSGRALAKRKEKIQKQMNKHEEEILARLEYEMDLYADRLSFDQSENDSYDVTLMERFEDFIYRDLSHYVFISESFIRELLMKKETETIFTMEAKLKKLDDLRKNLLVVYRRANRFVFPIASDPNFLLSVDECFVEPEIRLLRQRGKEFQEREAARYVDILNCLQNETPIRRILVLGEFGSGKNTVCSKLILDIVNRKFLFLERKYRLYICCDLNKFRDWNTKTLDEILVRFCHCYSSIIRAEDTRALLDTFKENILCIFTGYEYLPTYAREKVNFLLNQDNKEGTIFGHSTIVIATTADRDIGAAFTSYFEKHFALSRIKSDAAEQLLVKLFDDSEDGKDKFVEYLKNLNLLFLLEISPLIVIFACYVHKTYEMKDRHQFVVEVVNLMRECKKDKRIFKSRESFVEKELRKNDTVGRCFGLKFSAFDPKAYECYTYLTGKRLRLIDTFDRSSTFVQRSPACNLRSPNFEENANLYDQQVLAMNSLHKLFHEIHDLRNHIDWFLQLFTDYWVQNESVGKAVGDIAPRALFDQVRIEIMDFFLIHVFKRRNNIDYHFVSLLLSKVIENLDERKVTRLVRVPLASKLTLSPILLIATLFDSREALLSESEVISNIERCLFNCVNFETLKDHYAILLSRKKESFSELNMDIKQSPPAVDYTNVKAGLLAFLYETSKFEKRLREIEGYKNELDQPKYKIFSMSKSIKAVQHETRDISVEITLVQKYCAEFLEEKSVDHGKTLLLRVENVLSHMLRELFHFIEHLIQHKDAFSTKRHKYWDIQKYKGHIKDYDKMLARQEDVIKNWSTQFEESIKTIHLTNDLTLKNDTDSPTELIAETFGAMFEALRCLMENS